MAREEGDKEGISAGRFVHPNLLPPTRTVKIQGAGRGISGGRLVNPGPYGIGIDYENSYHFGKKAYPVSAISAVTIGTCWIQSVQFFIVGQDSAPVTQIPQGSQFYMKFHYHATNNLGSATNVWSVAVVYWEGPDPTTSTLTGYYFDDTFSDAGALTHATYLENTPSTPNFVMPARDITFNVNMFINDDHAPSVPYPVLSAWANTKT